MSAHRPVLKHPAQARMLYVVAFAYWDLEPKNFKVMALHSLDCLNTLKFCLEISNIKDVKIINYKASKRQCLTQALSENK